MPIIKQIILNLPKDVAKPEHILNVKNGLMDHVLKRKRGLKRWLKPWGDVLKYQLSMFKK
jgi:hypothetical protein